MAEDFRAFVAEHHARVLGAALVRCRDRSLAEDIAQEAFVCAWQDRSSLRDPSLVGAWVAGIARNLAATELRRLQRRARLAPVATDDTAMSPDELLAHARTRDVVQHALAQLPPAYREPVVEFYVHGASVREIAHRLHATEDTIRQRLTRGRKLLRSQLATKGLVLTTLVAARAHAASTSTKVWFAMSVKKVVLVACGVVAALVALFAIDREDPATKQAPMPSAARSTAAAIDATSSAPSRTLGPRTLAKDRDRAALLQAIATARMRRTDETQAASSPSAVVVSELDEDYVRAAVRELAPQVMECFEAGLERGAVGDGEVVVKFKIEGEEDIGAAVTESGIDETSTTLVDASVRDCIRDTMFAIKLDAPLRGGEMEVRKRYTFALNGPRAPPPAGADAGVWKTVEPE
jgi:RNA polymerase sigma factor (sigma-70 family)